MLNLKKFQISQLNSKIEELSVNIVSKENIFNQEKNDLTRKVSTSLLFLAITQRFCS
jgi:hypothetical protein